MLISTVSTMDQQQLAAAAACAQSALIIMILMDFDSEFQEKGERKMNNDASENYQEESEIFGLKEGDEPQKEKKIKPIKAINELKFSESVSKMPTNVRKPKDEERDFNNQIIENERAQKISDFLSPGFKSNIFACFGDPIGCLLTCCFPCIPSAVNRANLDEREVAWTDYLPCLCPNAYQTRQSIRAKYRMEVSPWNDCLAMMFCGLCVINQNTREIAERSDHPPVYARMPGKSFRDLSQALRRVSLTETR